MKLKQFQYNYKGEHNDTYHANSFAIKCMRVCTLIFIFCWVLNVLNIFIVDKTIMNIGMASSLVIYGASVIFAHTMGIDKPFSRYVFMSLMILMFTAICTEMSYHTTLLLIFPLVCSAQYFDKRITAFTWVFTCLGCAVSVLLGYRIGLCDSNMLLLTYTKSEYHIQALQSGNFEINSSLFLMFLYFVFPKWLLTLALVPLLNHVARDIQARSQREATARHLAEVDGLTGLYNRTKYLEALREEYPACDSVAVLFYDVNNLKTTNDTRGHEYGDALICGLASALHEKETETFKTYRIGGDEFVTVLTGEDAARLDEILSALDSELQGKTLDYGIRLSVAIGTASGKGTDIEKIIKEADDNMYRNKQAMKA